MSCPLSHCELQYLDIWHSCCPCVLSQFGNRNHNLNTPENCKFVTLFVLLPHNFSSLILLSLLILLAVKLSRLIILLILYFLCQIFLGGQFPAVLQYLLPPPCSQCHPFYLLYCILQVLRHFQNSR